MQLNKTLLTMALIAIGAIAVPISNDNSIQNINNGEPPVDDGYEGYGLVKRGDEPFGDSKDHDHYQGKEDKKPDFDDGYEGAPIDNGYEKIPIDIDSEGAPIIKRGDEPSGKKGYEALQKPEDYEKPHVNHKQGQGKGSIPKPDSQPQPEVPGANHDQGHGQGHSQGKSQGQGQGQGQGQPQPETPGANHDQGHGHGQGQGQGKPQGEHNKQPSASQGHGQGQGQDGYSYEGHQKGHGQGQEGQHHHEGSPFGGHGFDFLGDNEDKRPAAGKGYEGFSKRGGDQSFPGDELFKDDKVSKKPEADLDHDYSQDHGKPEDEYNKQPFESEGHGHDQDHGKPEDKHNKQKPFESEGDSHDEDHDDSPLVSGGFDYLGNAEGERPAADQGYEGAF